MSVNRVMLLGRLTIDPVIRYTQNGKAVTNFTLATNEDWIDANKQKQERTEFHNIVIWGKLGELASVHLKKGKQFYIEGSLQTRSWEDKEGNKRYTTEIVGKKAEFVDGFEKTKTNKTDNVMDAAQEIFKVDVEQSITTDDIPF